MTAKESQDPPDLCQSPFPKRELRRARDLWITLWQAA